MSAIFAQAAPTAVHSAADVTSIWDFVVKGGPVMIPLGICSLVALAVVIERFVTLRRTKVIPPDFLTGLKARLGSSSAPDSQRLALEYCRTNASPVANVFAAGLRRMREPLDLLEKHIEEEGFREARKLRKNLRVLSVIASVATLLGLLGTTLGMIVAFQTVANSAEALGKPELLAKGIYQKLITTATGLFIAIPCVLFYHYFAARVETLVAAIDRMTVDFVEDYVRAPAITAAPIIRSATSSNGHTAPVIPATEPAPIPRNIEIEPANA